MNVDAELVVKQKARQDFRKLKPRQSLSMNMNAEMTVKQELKTDLQQTEAMTDLT